MDFERPVPVTLRALPTRSDCAFYFLNFVSLSLNALTVKEEIVLIADSLYTILIGIECIHGFEVFVNEGLKKVVIRGRVDMELKVCLRLTGSFYHCKTSSLVLPSVSPLRTLRLFCVHILY